MGLWEARLLFVALILTGQGCSELLQWDCGDGISKQGNKDNPETKPKFCQCMVQWVWGQMSLVQDVPEGVQTPQQRQQHHCQATTAEQAGQE